jgi:isochorismate pyruvate lyase
MTGKTVALICKNSRANNPCYNSAAMQNDAPPKMPASCGTLEEVRDAIDALDAELVALLARRQACVERAAALKADRATVRDEARIEDVVQKVLAAARQAGLSPAIAEAVWRVLIERSIQHELRQFDAR